VFSSTVVEMGVQASTAFSTNARVSVARRSLGACHVWRGRKRGASFSAVSLPMFISLAKQISVYLQL